MSIFLATGSSAADTLSNGAHSSSGEWERTNFSAMGTVVELEFWFDRSSQERHSESAGFLSGKTISDRVRKEIERLEGLLSPYRESSEVSRINRAAGKGFVPVSSETFEILQAAREMSVLSGGAFDVSFASIGQHYDYRAAVSPPQRLIELQLDKINYLGIGLKEGGDDAARYVSLAQGMAIDLGGIAKGYTVDRVAALLSQAGVVSAAVSIGGDSVFLGDRGPAPDGLKRLPWMVAIKHPRPSPELPEGGHATTEKGVPEPGNGASYPDRAAHALKMPLVSTAFSTSGDYERFFLDEEGRRVHHILDPDTGKSASGLVSASVVGPESMRCDALSTTIFVLGAVKGLALVESIPDYDAVLIDANGQVHYSSGFSDGA